MIKFNSSFYCEYALSRTSKLLSEAQLDKFAVFREDRQKNMMIMLRSNGIQTNDEVYSIYQTISSKTMIQSDGKPVIVSLMQKEVIFDPIYWTIIDFGRLAVQVLHLSFVCLNFNQNID